MLMKFENAIAMQMLDHADEAEIVIEKGENMHMFFTHVSFSMSDKHIFPSVLIHNPMDVFQQELSSRAYEKIANINQTLYVFHSDNALQTFLRSKCTYLDETKTYMLCNK